MEAGQALTKDIVSPSLEQGGVLELNSTPSSLTLDFFLLPKGRSLYPEMFVSEVP